MTVFMVSLAGIPPLAGFWAKFLVFQVAIQRGGIGTALAIIMVINSVVSLSYYLAVPKQMLFVDGEHERPLVAPAMVTAVAVLASVAVVAVGVWPELLAHFPPLSTLVGQ
jgi:NADH:ubiquinone oxidoreductase subunit 2 (subunit N)